MQTYISRDLETGKKIKCENTGKKLGDRVIWRNVETGELYERMNPNGVKMGMRGKLFFRKYNKPTTEYILQNIL